MEVVKREGYIGTDIWKRKFLVLIAYKGDGIVDIYTCPLERVPKEYIARGLAGKRVDLSDIVHTHVQLNSYISERFPIYIGEKRTTIPTHAEKVREAILHKDGSYKAMKAELELMHYQLNSRSFDVDEVERKLSELSSKCDQLSLAYDYEGIEARYLLFPWHAKEIRTLIAEAYPKLDVVRIPLRIFQKLYARVEALETESMKIDADNAALNSIYQEISAEASAAGLPGEYTQKLNPYLNLLAKLISVRQNIVEGTVQSEHEIVIKVQILRLKDRHYDFLVSYLQARRPRTTPNAPAGGTMKSAYSKAGVATPARDISHLKRELDDALKLAAQTMDWEVVFDHLKQLHRKLDNVDILKSQYHPLRNTLEQAFTTLKRRWWTAVAESLEESIARSMEYLETLNDRLELLGDSPRAESYRDRVGQDIERVEAELQDAQSKLYDIRQNLRELN